MTKDFAKNASKDRNRSATRSAEGDSSSSGPTKPFLIGSVFGIVLCLGVQWLLTQDSESLNPETLGDNLEEALEIENITGPVLDFYTTLSDVEVLVREDELERVSKDLVYLLQAGSFRQAEDADAMRAQLILLNLEAEISKFNHNGEIWHRVIVGPFTERTDMAKTRTTLLENGIESLLLTKPAES